MSTIQFKNISPLGSIEVPALRRTLDAGEIFDVTAEHAALLREQPDVYRELKTEKKPAKATGSEPTAAAETTSDDTNGEAPE